MKPKILVVEDERQHIILLKVILTNYDIISAHNGEDALDLLPDPDIELIITDIAMPKINGLQFAQAVRKIPNHQDTPIIAITATSTATNFHDIQDTNFSAMLIKPIKVTEIHSTVERVLA